MIHLYATFGATDIRTYVPEGVPVLLPASSFARFRRKNGSIRPAKLPAHINVRAADSGGFVATRKHGDYRYSPAQYVEWLQTFMPRWAATMDYCCEPPIAPSCAVLRARQDRTTEMAWHFWDTYRDMPWAWVPTLQGWQVDDYLRHADDLFPLLCKMQAHYAATGKGDSFRVGIGSLCQRASLSVIHQVAQSVAFALPGFPLHLWGVKGAAVNNLLPAQIVSVDSAAWTFGANRNRLGTGRTCREQCIQHQLPEYIRRHEARMRATSNRQ